MVRLFLCICASSQPRKRILVPLQPMKDEISYANIWRIAYPIIIGSVSQTILNITDTVFVGRLGELELAAGALGVLIYLTIIMVINGFTIGNQIIMARRFGEDRPNEIGRTFSNAFFLLFAIVTLVFVSIKLAAPSLITNLVSNRDIATLVGDFVQVRIWGLFFAAFMLLFRAFYVATANTKVLIAVTSTTVGLNIILNYALIFGKLGLPAYGFVGAAMASVISELVGFIIILGFTIYNRYFTKFSLVKLRYFKSKIVGEILKIASPMMLQHLISFSAWFVIFLIIERMGERSLAISNIVRSLYITMMVPIWGFAEATNSLVSFLMGEKRFERVPILVRRSMLLSFSGVFLIVCLSYPFLHQIIGFYTADPNLIAATLPVVKVVMLGSIIMSLGFIAFMAISGTGNTLIAFGLEFSDIALYIVLAYILTVHLNANVTTMWFIETFYSGYMLIVCLLYLRFGKWREKIV